MVVDGVNSVNDFLSKINRNEIWSMSCITSKFKRYVVSGSRLIIVSWSNALLCLIRNYSHNLDFFKVSTTVWLVSHSSRNDKNASANTRN